MADVTTQCRDISELTSNAQTACRLFLDRCARCGLNVFITETYRSQERQNYLYSLGRTLSGKKVTWTKNSRHTSRRAWDIACKGDNLYDSAVLKKCGTVAVELGITWGGIWNTPDYPHFEVSEDWNYSEEDEKMTESEKAKIQAIDDSLTNLYRIVEEMKKKDIVYNTVSEIPEWGRAAVEKLIDEGKLHGDGSGLNIDYDMLRMIVMLS